MSAQLKGAGRFHRARWETLLIVLSWLLTVLCGGVAAGLISRDVPGSEWTTPLILGLVIGCALFVVRGYSITPDTLNVHRLLWTTRIPLSGLLSVTFEPGAMAGSLRLFGNGGFYSFTGYYRNKRLGIYRAFVTDRSKTVVLRFAKRPVVVSPEFPLHFVDELNASAAQTVPGFIPTRS